MTTSLKDQILNDPRSLRDLAAEIEVKETTIDQLFEGCDDGGDPSGGEVYLSPGPNVFAPSK